MTEARLARSIDLAGFPRLASLAQSGGVATFVAGSAEAPEAAAALDLDGGPVEQGTPRIHLEATGPLAEGRTAVAAVLEAAVAAAAAAGSARVLLAWDTMDAPGLKVLESLGFRPTGTWPYFLLGGGLVEHVMGYRDPAGSLVDLHRPMP